MIKRFTILIRIRELIFFRIDKALYLSPTGGNASEH